MFLLLLPHRLSYSLTLYLTVVFSLNLSPQSSVQAAISGHAVTMTTPGHRAAGAHSGMSFFLSFSAPLLPPSVSSVSIWSCPLSRSLFSDFTLFPHTSLLVWSCTPFHLLLFCPLYVSRCLSVSLCLSRDNPAAGWWKVGSPASHVERLFAKHIKAARRHIRHSQMMIRVPGSSNGTESSVVMQDICLFTSCIKPSSDKGLTL